MLPCILLLFLLPIVMMVMLLRMAMDGDQDNCDSDGNCDDECDDVNGAHMSHTSIKPGLNVHTLHHLKHV